MVDFMGRSSDPTSYPARFLYLADETIEPMVVDASLTLYDARRFKSDRSPEYRFYFANNSVTETMSPGDLLVIAKQRQGGLLVLVAESDSTIASQVEWLFGLEADTVPGFSIRVDLDHAKDQIALASRLVLENIGIEVEVVDDSYLDQILAHFGATWPDTKAFSPFARSIAPEVDAEADPDAALLAWVDCEYILFQTLEKHLISERLNAGFTGESAVEAFLSYSLSVQNRRKSRSGSSLENHIEQILKLNHIAYVRGAKTEENSKPDFLFPGVTEYRDMTFPESKLYMLASKRSAKDRWRQILAEAARIPNKHLLTLEAAISHAQTDEMTRQKVQLVLPTSLHASFTPAQQSQLMTVKEFTELIKS